MSTYLILLAIAILIVAMILTLVKYSGRRERRPAPPAARRGATSIRQRTRWRAVKIAPGLIACDAAQALTDQIFLASETPHLPLGNCAQADCRCKYVHLDDRRSGSDRRLDLGSLGSYLPKDYAERRHGADRRARGAFA